MTDNRYSALSAELGIDPVTMDLGALHAAASKVYGDRTSALTGLLPQPQAPPAQREDYGPPALLPGVDPVTTDLGALVRAREYDERNRPSLDRALEFAFPATMWRHPDTPETRHAYDAALHGAPGRLPDEPGSPVLGPYLGPALDVLSWIAPGPLHGPAGAAMLKGLAGHLVHGAGPIVPRAAAEAAEVAAPAVVNRDAPWHILAAGRGGHTVDQFSRDAWDEHIGRDPAEFLRSYVGRGYYDPGSIGYAASGSPDAPVLGLAGRLVHPHNGDGLGAFDRTLLPAQGAAEHGVFRIHPDYQGQGFGNVIANNMMDTYADLASPITRIEAHGAGGHELAKRGWLPIDEPQNLRALQDGLWDRLEALQQGGMPKAQAGDVAAILGRNGRDRGGVEPEVLHDLIENFTGAPKLLRGLGYDAVFDTANPYQMRIFDATRRTKEPGP